MPLALHDDQSSRTMRSQVSDAEWQARIELAAFYRALAKLGMTDHIYNHITLRVPGEPGCFLVNSFGLTYPEVTASSLYKIDIEGNIKADPENGFGLNRAAFVIHGAIHGAREDLACVVHTHTRASVAVSIMEEGLLPLSQQACVVIGRIGYHEFYGPVVDLEERKKLVANLGAGQMMFLRNHGTLVCGRTIAETFVNTYLLETACKIQVDVMRSGARLVIPSQDIVDNTTRIIEEHKMDGTLEWAAMRRTLDAAGEDYAQ